MQDITEIEMIDVYLSELCEQPATHETKNRIDRALDARNRWVNIEEEQSISRPFDVNKGATCQA